MFVICEVMINYSSSKFDVSVRPALQGGELCNYFREELVDCAFLIRQCARFIAPDAVLLQLLKQVVEGDAPVLLKIALISHQEFKYVLIVAVLINVVHVLVYRFKRIGTVHRVHNDHCVRASVKVARNRLHRLSSRRVPNIQLHL